MSVRERVWTRVCRLDDITADRGVAALVDGVQVAIFRLSATPAPAPLGAGDAAADEVVALSNLDPFSGAFVLSRGLVGSKGDVLTVAAPVYKQRFDLRTGTCIDDPAVAVPVHDARVVDGWVEVRT